MNTHAMLFAAFTALLQPSAALAGGGVAEGGCLQPTEGELDRLRSRGITFTFDRRNRVKTVSFDVIPGDSVLGLVSTYYGHGLSPEYAAAARAVVCEAVKGPTPLDECLGEVTIQVGAHVTLPYPGAVWGETCLQAFTIDVGQDPLGYLVARTQGTEWGAGDRARLELRLASLNRASVERLRQPGLDDNRNQWVVFAFVVDED